MNKVKLNIWGRDFNLMVDFDDDKPTDKQIEALESFVAQQDAILGDSKKVLDYCKKVDKDRITSDNVFKYVMPHYIYMKRNAKTIAIMCNYKFDMEHGIAVVFENNKFNKVVVQDKIL